MKHSPTQRAQAVVHATYFGDKAAIERFSIHDRTLRRWKAALETDPTLREEVRRLRADRDEDWRAEIDSALASCVCFLGRAAREADPSDPDAIHSVAGALKILSEACAMNQILDLKLTKHRDRSNPKVVSLVGRGSA